MAKHLRPLRGATWNAERDRSASAVRRYLRRMVRRHRLDFVLLQEFADYTGHLRRHPVKGYRLLVPDNGHDERQCPILVRDTVHARYARVLQMADSGWITVTGAHYAPPKSVAVLLDGWLRAVSIHAPVSVSWPGGRIAGPSRRVAAYLSHSAHSIRFARRGQRMAARRLSRGDHAKATLLGGDWNARTWERGTGTPWWLARKAGLRIAEPRHRKGPGHDGIDYVLTDARVTRVRKHGTGGSDHPFVTFTVHPPA